MKKALATVLFCVVVLGVGAAQTGTATPKKAKKKSAPTAAVAGSSDLSEIKSMLQSQQRQIQSLQQQVQSRDQQIQQLQQRLDQNQAAAQQAQSQAQSAVESTSKIQNDLTDLKMNATSAAVSLQETQKQVKEASEHPTTIHFKGISITPGGFIAAETVNRTRTTSGDINTPFTGIPYSGNSLSKLSEFNFTARQSRLSLLAEGKVGSTKYSGYYEMDFLGTGVTSNNRQSNSYVFRQRQLFARVDFDGGWAFTGGQQWSLATENVKGIVNRNERFPLQIDPQYVVGFTWQRAYAARLVKTWDKVAVGFSIEGPQTTIGGRGFSTFTNTPVTGAATIDQNFWFNAPGAGGGLYNFSDTTGYTVNKLPDFLAKAAFDPGGNWGHYELFGILSDFRSRVYPCAVVGTDAANVPPPGVATVLNCPQDPVNPTPKPSSLGAYNDSRVAGGLGGSAFWTMFGKKVDFGLKTVAGDGIGRFGTAQLADVTARPDGTLAPIRTLHYLVSLALHPNKKWDFYGYWGQEYAARAYYAGYQSVTVTNTPAVPGCGDVGEPACIGVPPGTIQGGVPATTKTVIKTTGQGGYGNPTFNNSGCSTENPPAGTGAPSGGGSCAGDIRVIGEGTLGFWHKVYQGDKGRFQWGIQYSYIYKIGWSGTNSGATDPIAPKAINNMIFTSFRYYLP